MDKSPQVPLGCRMEQSSCHNSKVGTYLLRSTVAKKEEPEGHIHVVAAILHTPLHAGLLQLCLCSGRMEIEVGEPCGLVGVGCIAAGIVFNKLLHCLLGPGSQVT